MEKTVHIDIEEKAKTFVLTGDTEVYRSQFVNLGGTEYMRTWIFPNKLRDAVIQIISEKPMGGVEGVALNPELLSTEEIVEVCTKNNLADDPTNLDTCLKGADEEATQVDGDIVREQIRKELGKMRDVDEADPKIVYEVIVGYFGQDISPSYTEFLPLFEEEFENISGGEGEELPSLPGVTLPKPAKTIIPEETKVRKPRKKKVLEINAKTQRIFDEIHEGVLRDIISFTPKGVEFISAETTKEAGIADVKTLLHQDPDEDATTYKLRRNITGKIALSKDLKTLTPDAVILMGYIITKKVQYAVRYDPFVEAAVTYVMTRV